MFVAAMVNDSNARDALISRIHSRALFNQSGDPFPLSYDTNGKALSGIAR